MIFGVDLWCCSSSHADNCKNNVLVLDEGPTFGANGSFAWVSKIMPKIVVCLLMGKKSLNLKPTIKMLTFQPNFFSKVYLMDLVLLSLKKYLWIEMCMTFQSVKVLLNSQIVAVKQLKS